MLHDKFVFVFIPYVVIYSADFIFKQKVLYEKINLHDWRAPTKKGSLVFFPFPEPKKYASTRKIT